MKQIRFFASLRMTIGMLRMTVALIVLLASGLSAFAASTFTVSNPTGSTFRITRTGNTSVAETIDWRVVSLSAIAGVHFTGYNGNYSGQVTFNVNDTYKDVTISESTPGDNAYKYQNGSSRSYRFEVLDRNGDILSSCDRTITSGLSQFSAAKVSNSVTNLVTMSNGNFSSGMSSSKYLDVSYTPPSGDVQGSKQDLPGYVLIDDSYDYAQKPATVSTSSLINSTGASASYLNSQSYKIYATVCFTEKERDDGYQYLQIIAGNSTASYDTGADPNGQVNNPSNSIYKVCFEFADNSNAEGKIYFPHRGTTSSEFSNSNGVLHQQKYKSGYDGNGAVILPVTTSYITTRFDAGGDNDDTWGYKDFFVRMALRDNTAPTVLNNYKVSGGRHQKGNTVYVSVAFSEIVTVTGTPTLASNWGTLRYVAGSGSNVLTFKGTIDPTDNNPFSVSSYSLNGGTIKDLAGNSFSGSISHSFGTTLDADYAWSTSDFNSLAANTYEIASKIDLRHLALLVNAAKNPCTGLTFQQTQDITCDNTYIPIGYYVSGSDKGPFCGTYDGDGKTVSGITVSRTGSTDADNFVGLFGYVYYNTATDYGTVRNVVLANSTFTGCDFVGGIVGHNRGGTVENCRVESTVTINAGADNSIRHGGIVGYNFSSYAKVIGCYSAAVVSNNSKSSCKQYGGIVGYNYGGIVKDCLYAGTTVTADTKKGAIVGYDDNNDGVFTNNYYTAISLGGVGADGSNSDQDGARRARTVTLGENVVIVGDETAYDVSGLTAIGSGNYALQSGSTIYSGESQTLTFSYTGDVPVGYNQTYSATAGTIDGNTLTMPAQNVTVSAAFPPIPWSGSGDSANDPYLIEYPSQLDLLATNVNAGNVYQGKYFRQTADLAYDNTENNYVPIGRDINYDFRGTYDGQGKRISGINRTGNTSSDQYFGIFGFVGQFGKVQNVVLSNSTFTGYNKVGGIAGNCYGTVQNCRVENTVTINAGSNSATSLGGIAGYIGNYSTAKVIGCISTATVSNNGKSGCYYFGGIVGYHGSGTISDCLYTGSTVIAADDKGAISGYMTSSATLSNNYYTNISLGGVRGSDVEGAKALYSLTLPSGVTLVRTASATLPGTGNATYTTGADINGTPYAFEGAELSLSYTGDAAAEGYSIALYVNGVQATDNGNGTYTATMPAADANVTVGQTPILSYFWGPNDGDSADHPYTISTTAGLDLLATMVNSGNDYSGKYFELANDITYTHTSDWNDANSTENNYTAIGGYTKTFNGTFDGKGYTVSGIRIYKNGTGNTAGFQGLFGNAGSNSTVKNLTISDVRITGRNSVGGVAGYSSGLIENCHVTATVCIHAVQSNSDYHGGIVGQSAAQNRGCTSSVKLTIKDGITGCYSYGGIVGYKQDGFIRECLSIGVSLPSVTQVGAIAGLSYLNSSIVKNFFHDCTIGSSAATVGYTYNDNDYSTAGWAEPSYTVTCAAGITATASGTLYANYDYDGLTVYQYGDKYGITYGGIAYYAAGPTVTLSGTGSAPAGYQEPFLGYSLNGADLPGNTFEMTAADATVTARWTVIDFETGHAGTEADPYIIYNKDQLNLLAEHVNSVLNYSSGKYFKLGADIDYDGTENNYTPIGQSTTRFFKGTFDGDGHTINGINITGEEDRRGLFGRIEGGTVKNVTLSSSSISGAKFVGGIVGQLSNSGTVTGCRVENTVTIASGGRNSEYLGGIVGQLSKSCTVTGCISSATVTSNGYSSCKYYGGIVGYGNSNSTVQNCLAIGCNITGSFAGAIVGDNTGTFSNNYYANCTVYGTSINKGYYNGDITDNDGAVRAVSSTTKPAEIGAQIASYSGGLTVYEHGAYYNGTYYLRHDLAGTAEPLTLVQGTKDGVSAYWGTYFDSTTNYELSEGAAAYTLGTDFKLYRMGTNGRTIPKNTAVVIIATSADASLVAAGTGDLGITDHASGGNILVGNDTPTSYSTIYVLSLSAGEVGFRKLSTGTLPAHKAGYKPQAGMQDYDKQGNQEW